MLKVVMRVIFQEEKTVDERDANSTASKKYVSSGFFFLPLDKERFLTIRK